MDTLFDTAFSFTVGEEGGYSTDPADPGNWTGGVVGRGVLKGTRWGISAAAHPGLDIATLTLAAARAIYHAAYWAPIGADGLPAPLALASFDAAVNAGPARAAIWLQEALGVAADGIVGPQTQAAARAAVASGAAAAAAVLSETIARRLLFLAGLPDWPRFGLGWTRRCLALQARALTL